MEINKKVFLFLLAIMAISSVAMERNDPAIGMYTKAFEYEVQNNECRKLKCQIVKSYGSYTSTQPVEVGYSEVPGIYGHPYKVKHFVIAQRMNTTRANLTPQK
jgi:hypothetical protein